MFKLMICQLLGLTILLSSNLAFAKTTSKKKMATKSDITDSSNTLAEKPMTENDLKNWHPIGKGRYISGAAAGTLFGFGIGHAIHRNYGKIGWVFTTGEVLSLAMISVGGLRTAVATSALNNGEPAEADPLFVAGVIGFLGFKIWETVDLWVRPLNMNRKYRESKKQSTASFGIIPLRGGGAQALFGMSF